jgi:ribosomal protein L29
MEIQELKELWQAESQRLEQKIELNETALRKMNMEKAVGRFDKLVEISIFGRNLALVYGVISLVAFASSLDRLEISIPLLVAALAMFWSFQYHLVIVKPKEYHEISLVELQKLICNFRIHTSSSAKYDVLVVLLWFLTLIPFVIQIVFDVSVYENSSYGLPVLLAITALCLISRPFVVKIYAEYETELSKAENYLEEIIDFEKA